MIFNFFLKDDILEKQPRQLVFFLRTGSMDVEENPSGSMDVDENLSGSLDVDENRSGSLHIEGREDIT